MPPDQHDLAAHQADRLRALFAALPANPFYARKFGIESGTPPPDPLPRREGGYGP